MKRKSIYRFFTALVIFTAIFLVINASAQSLIVNTTLTITSDTTFDDVQVTSTGVLIADAEITILNDMTIDSGGIITHSVRLLEGLQLNVTGTLDIQSGGMIDVSEKGLRGGSNGGNPSINGETYDENDSIVAEVAGGSPCGAGASFGGQGASGTGVISNSPYGLLEDAQHLGSGGGAAGPGGNGGGRMTINAGTCIVNGQLSANGGNGGASGTSRAGGGSGGSILLNIDTFSGSGTIQVHGGNGGSGPYGWKSGAGSGGRIAILYTSNSFPEVNITSYGGLGGGNKAAAGTIYLKDNAQTNGDLIVDNGNVSSALYTPLLTGLTFFQNIELGNQAKLHPISADITSFNIDLQIILKNNSVFWLSNGVSLSVLNSNGFDLNVESGSLFILDTIAGLNANAIRIDGGTMNTYQDLSFPIGTDMELSGGGMLNILNNSILDLEVFDTTNIISGSVNIPEESQLNIASNSAIIGSGVTLIKDGTFGTGDLIGSLTVLSGGIVTHSTRLLEGLQLNVTGTLDIQSGGMIDVSAKGLRGGNSDGNPSGYGETYDENDSIVAEVGWGGNAAGASFGGQGANSTSVLSNSPYGVLEDARHLGSGGGGSGGTGLGGNGGGLMTINAGTCIVNGQLISNGDNGGAYGTSRTGGGSGGSILLNIDVFSGSGTIQSHGGNGVSGVYGGRSGSGSGGRIAIFHTSTSFPEVNITAYSGLGNGNRAAAGTIYLKDNAQTNGDLIVDNGNIISSRITPLLSNLIYTRKTSIKNNGNLNVPYSYPLTGDTVFLEYGTLSTYDTILLQNGILTGSGFVQGPLINAATISPGSSTDSICITGNYIQEPSGELNIELGGLEPGTEIDQLIVNGNVTLDGTLNVIYIDGFEPTLGDWFDILTYDTIVGEFSDVNGWNNYSVTYFPNKATLMADYNYITNSTADPFIILSPSGSIGYEVTLLDENGLPVVGSDNAWLDFSESYGLVNCPQEPNWPYVNPSALSDSAGIIKFFAHAGGCTADSLKIMSSHGLVAKVPIKSLDQNGGLVVSIADFLGVICNDYNNDGVVDDMDLNFFFDHIGETCVDQVANHLTIEISTNPGPEAIYQGDTIQICAKIINHLNEVVILDSANFLTAGWGINRPWTKFSQSANILIGPLQMITVVHNYVVPDAIHGCFQVQIFPILGINSKLNNPDSQSIMSKDRNRYDNFSLHDRLGNNQRFNNHKFSLNQQNDVNKDNPCCDHPPIPNPCSPPDMKCSVPGFGWAFWAIPDAPECCVDHDYCYKSGGCSSSWESCDVALRDCLYNHGHYVLGYTFYKALSQTEMGKGRCNFCFDNNCPEQPLCTECHSCCECYGGNCSCDDCHSCMICHPEVCCPFCNPKKQLNVNARNKQGLFSFGKTFNKTQNKIYWSEKDTTKFIIPIGTENNDTLIIFKNEDLPIGWSYTINNTDAIACPDTIVVNIIHPCIIPCSDTGRVILTAFDIDEEFMGQAELMVYSIGTKGDFNTNDTVNVSDLYMLLNYEFLNGSAPILPETAELTNDGKIDIADITRLIDYLYSSQEPFICEVDTSFVLIDIEASSLFENDTTTIFLNTPIDLRGLELVMSGLEGAEVYSILDGELDLIYGQLLDSLRIGLLDTNGVALIPAGYQPILKIPGDYQIDFAVAGDFEFHSQPVTYMPGDPQPGYIYGTITLGGSLPYNIGEVSEVLLEAGTYSATPDATGYFEIEAFPGIYDISTSLYGYENVVVPKVIVNSGNLEIILPCLYGIAEGAITSEVTGNPIEGAMVLLEGTAFQITTGSDGIYEFICESETYDITVTADGYESQTITGIVVNAETTIVQDIELSALGLAFFPESVDTTLQPNETGETQLEIQNPSSYSVDWTVTIPGNPSWVLCSPVSGTIPPGGTEMMDINFNALDLIPDIYQATIEFSTTPNIGTPIVEVTMTVDGLIPATNLSLDFECTDVNLSWEMLTGGNPDSWNIYRDNELIANVTEMLFTNEMVELEIEICYEIRAVYGGEESFPTLPECITVPTPENLEPLNPEAVYQGEGSVLVTWEEPEACLTPDVYNIYRDEVMVGNSDTTEYFDTGLNPGLYKYYINASYYFGSSGNSDTTSVSVLTGINQLPENYLEVFPNPTKDLVNVNSSYTVLSIEIVNNKGKIVLSKEINSNNFQVSVGQFETGIFYLKFITDEGFVIKKILVH